MYQQAPVEVMVSRHIVGKMPKSATVDQWREFHMSFRLQKTTAHGLAVEIYRGYSFCPVYAGRRKKENFQRAWHIALDFDSGDERSRIETLSTIDIVKDLASFVYTTPSHTEQTPKARVVWIFPEPASDIEQYEKLFKALLYKFPYADQGVKDGLRLYYGSPKCKLIGHWNLLENDVCRELVTEYEAHIQKTIHVETPVVITPAQVSSAYMQRKLESILDKVSAAREGEKHNTLLNMSILLGGFCAAGYYAVSDIRSGLQNAVSAMANVASREAAYKTIEDGLSIGLSKPIYVERPYNVGDHHA